MARTGRPATRHIAAIERATRVLDALGASDRPLGTNELARACAVNASTVSRVLATLVGAGYVEHLTETGRYRLGARLVQLGQAALGGRDLRELARPRLEALAARTGETATLCVATEREAITVDYAHGNGSVISVARIGRPSVPHATAVGKVMLAFGTIEIGTLALPPFTPATIVDAARLADELAAVRRQGYATAFGERELDLNALAAPVRGAKGGLVAIVGLQGPALRLTGDAIAAARPHVIATADELAAALGG